MKTFQATKELVLTVNATLAANVVPSTNPGMSPNLGMPPNIQAVNQEAGKTFLNVSGQSSLNSKQLGNFNQRFELTTEELNKPVSLAGHDGYLEDLGIIKLKAFFSLGV